MSDRMRVAVLMGGDSSERDISLQSGRAVAEGLRRAGHQVHELEIPSVAAVIFIWPSLGVNLAALSMRLSRICSSLSSLAKTGGRSGSM